MEVIPLYVYVHYYLDKGFDKYCVECSSSFDDDSINVVSTAFENVHVHKCSFPPSYPIHYSVHERCCIECSLNLSWLVVHEIET